MSPLGQIQQRLLRLIATTVAALVTICLAAEAADADAAQVTVVSPGGSSRTLALEALAGSEDVRERGYTLRSDTGASTVTVTGFSLAALLAAADVDTFGFSYLEVQRPAGGSVQLSRDQALGEGAFPEGPPVLYATATGTAFLRPASAADDLNAADSFEAPQGITVALRKGAALEVDVRASTERTETGEPVDFEAIVERAGSGERLTYAWNFGDGGQAAGASATHVFRKRGSYDVVVGVTTAGDEVGTSAVVTVQVGEPLAGPDRKGGGTNRAADAPDHGAAEGPATGAGGSLGATPSLPSGVPSEPAAVESTPPPAPQPRPERERPEPQPAPRGELISGELLDPNAEPPPPEETPTPAAARTGSLDSGQGGAGVSGTAIGVLATLGLLGLGAVGEARGLAGLRIGRRS